MSPTEIELGGGCRAAEVDGLSAATRYCGVKGSRARPHTLLAAAPDRRRDSSAAARKKRRQAGRWCDADILHSTANERRAGGRGAGEDILNTAAVGDNRIIDVSAGEDVLVPAAEDGAADCAAGEDMLGAGTVENGGNGRATRVDLLDAVGDVCACDGSAAASDYLLTPAEDGSDDQTGRIEDILKSTAVERRINGGARLKIRCCQVRTRRS